jgi:two-component system sensor histidine kinase YesM
MKWRSIRTKLIVFMLLPSITCIMITMFVTYSYTTHSLRTRAVDENHNLLFQGAKNIHSLLEEINRVSLTVYSDSDFYRLLEAGYEDVAANTRIYMSLNYMATTMPDIYQVYLYGIKDKKATLVTQKMPKRWQAIQAYPSSIVDSSAEPVAIEETHVSHTYGLTAPLQAANTEVFSFHRRIEKVPSNHSLGFLSLDIKLSALSDIADQLYDQEKESLYIVDDNQNLIYSSNQDSIGQKIKHSWYKGNLRNSTATQGFFEQDHAVFIYQRIDGPGAEWMLIKRIPSSHLLREANKAVSINLLVLTCVLIVIIAATIFISIRFTSPIKKLASYMNQVQIGNLNVDIKSTSNDEIGLLTNRFRSMMDHINNLILREYKLALSNKSNQLKALQAQINPHFLNNTLQIIGTLALELGVPRIYALLTALAKMMHYSMHNTDKTITLDDELEHVKAYVELQKERFENKFTFEYEIEDGLLDAVMPKMILQPILENYFKHGLERGRSDGFIKLSAFVMDNQQIQIKITNNGAIIPLDQLQILQQELAQFKLTHWEINEETGISQTESIGLINVLARLKLCCGDQAELHIANIGNSAVEITLQFDILEGNVEPT